MDISCVNDVIIGNNRCLYCSRYFNGTLFALQSTLEFFFPICENIPIFLFLFFCHLGGAGKFIKRTQVHA